MKIGEERTVKQVFNIAIKCDMCGKISNRGDGWGKHIYEEKSTTIEYDKGEIYPDGGYLEKLSIDLCPDCFEKVLIPFLKSKGVDCEFEDVSW